MTEEEMKAKIDELEDRIKAKDSTISSLESQRSNQNAYITKLEAKARTLESNMENVKSAVSNTKEFPPEVVEYFQKKRREDYTEQAYAQIKQTVSEDVFNILEPEVRAFCKAYMTEANVSVKYIVDAFHLLLGKAYSDPNHAIHRLKKVEEPKAPTPSAVETPSRNEIANQIARMQNQGMTNGDQQMMTPPPTEPVKVNNTREAMSAFKTRLLNGFDSTKFE